MTEFEKLKDRVETLRNRKAKAEGQQEMIKKTWKETFGTDNIDEVRAIVEQAKEDLAALEQKKADYIAKANAILDAAGV